MQVLFLCATRFWGQIGDSVLVALPLCRWSAGLSAASDSSEATMASLERRGKRYRIVFRFGGRKFQHPLKTANEGEASSCLARSVENLRLLERGRLVLPHG